MTTQQVAGAGGPDAPEQAARPEGAAARRRKPPRHPHRVPPDPRDPAGVSGSGILPVAGRSVVRGFAAEIARRRPKQIAAALSLHAAAAVAGLVAPRMLGDIVQKVAGGAGVGAVDTAAAVIVAALLVQGVLVCAATNASARLGERILAELREEFVDRVLELPLSVVERAGTGDLTTRMTRDVDSLSRTVRFAAPEILIAFVKVLLTVGAVLLVDPRLMVPALLAAPPLYVVTRWYLRRAPNGYLREEAAFARITEDLAETVQGARTVEALRLAEVRRRRTDKAISGSWLAERYTLYLRTVFFPTLENGYLIPVGATLLAGGWMYAQGWVTLGQVTAAVLYMQQLMGPLDALITWLDELQVGAASLARLLGVREVRDDRPRKAAAQPDGERIIASDVRYSYVAGREVLHGVDLDLRPGERLAVVGPSGAGKSTLGRLLAGVHGPGSGSVRVGGVDLASLPMDELRQHVALVTQEHHVFAGTVFDNLAMVRQGADEPQVWAALEAVAADGWVKALPDGLSTVVGTGNLELTAAQAQQLALARLVLADPHTLVLDEATSLLDPRAARDLERSLGAVLEGRTVVAIAHRLQTAHDAERVAVVEDGRISELGSHDELLARGGSYAALWRSWHGEDGPAQAGIDDEEEVPDGRRDAVLDG